jgi:YbbR domain-containing protein
VTWLRTAGLRLVLAIGLGFALWIFVSYTENPDRLTQFKDLPVTPEGLTPGLVIVDQNGLPNPPLPPVTVTLRSIGETAITPSSNDIQAYVDLSERGPGEWSIPVGARVTIPGRRPEVSDINPDLLAIRIEQEITRTVPLTIEVVGSVPFSYQALPASAAVRGQLVAEVQVTGPQSRVERVTVARATANIDRLTGNYDSPRQIDPVDADGQVVSGVTVEPERVNVSVPIVSIAGIKRVPVVPSIVGEPASGFVVTGLSVEPQFVRLAGGSGSLENVQNITTEPVNIAGAGQSISQTVRLREPEATPLLFGEPISATVTVRVAAIERPFQVKLPVPVQLANVAAGLLGSINPTIVEITVSGTAARLGTLDTPALVGTVNASGLSAGVYSIAPTFQLPSGIVLVGVPPKVTVALRLPASPTPQPAPTETASHEPTAPPPTETPPSVPATPPAETPGPTATPGG